MFNIHAHIFTVKDVPVGFLSDNLPDWLAKQVVRMLQAGGWRQKIAMLAVSNTEQGKKYKAFVNVGIHKTMDEVFDVLREDNDYPDGTKFVALPMQFEMMGAGACETHSYEDQITELVQTKKNNADVLYPFYAIDPRMATTEEEVAGFVRRHMQIAVPGKKDASGAETFVRAFYGIKLYPSLGFFPYDPLLRATYQYAQENDLPIMTHCSRGGVNYMGKRSQVPNIYAPKTMNHTEPCLFDYTNPAFRKEPKYSYPGIDDATIKNADFCDYFLDPENYVDALGLYPDLKICFAHFGSDSEVSTKLNIAIGDTKPAAGAPRNDTWYDKVVSLLKNDKWPNLFTDISYTLHIKEFRQLVKDEVEKDLAAHNDPNSATVNTENRLLTKILYGTDFFMTYREAGVTEKMLVDEAKKDFIDIDPAKYPMLYKLGVTSLWDAMTMTNPKRYMSSKFSKF